MSGVVSEINERLNDEMTLVNKSPMHDGTCALLTPGWLAKIKLSNPGEFDQLLNGEAYKAHCEGESEASD